MNPILSFVTVELSKQWNSRIKQLTCHTGASYIHVHRLHKPMWTFLEPMTKWQARTKIWMHIHIFGLNEVFIEIMNPLSPLRVLWPIEQLTCHSGLCYILEYRIQIPLQTFLEPMTSTKIWLHIQIFGLYIYIYNYQYSS